MARLRCCGRGRRWSLCLERRWSLLLLRVLNLHWRLQRPLNLTQAVRVEDALELGLHLLEELLPQEVEVRSGTTATTATTAASSASTATAATSRVNIPGSAIRTN